MKEVLEKLSAQHPVSSLPSFSISFEDTPKNGASIKVLIPSSTTILVFRLLKKVDLE